MATKENSKTYTKNKSTTTTSKTTGNTSELVAKTASSATAQSFSAMGGGMVLIVPGYTDDEILEMNGGSKTDTTDTTDTEDSDSEDKTDTTNSSKSSKSKKSSKNSKKTTKTSSKESKSDTKTTKTKTTNSATHKKKKSTDKVNNSKKNSKNSKDSKDSKDSTSKNSDEEDDKGGEYYSTSKAKSTTSNKTVKKIDEPKSILFETTSVDYTPHRKDYEEFNSAEGMIGIEKACDIYAEVKLSVLVHQVISHDTTASLTIDGSTKGADIRLSAEHPEDIDPGTSLPYYSNPNDFSNDFIELRRAFFEPLMGRPLTVVSDLFPTIVVGYISDLNYNIEEGEVPAKWDITIKEYENLGF